MLKGYYAMMASQLKLSAEQQTKLAAIAEESSQAGKKWEEQNGEKLKQLKVAAKGSDAAAAEKAKTELKTLDEEREKLKDQTEAKINDLLTPDQRIGWASSKLYLGASMSFSKAALTDAQKDQIRKLCDEAAKTQASATDKKSDSALKAELRKEITDKVLTDAQKADLSGGKAQKADKADKGEKAKEHKHEH
jgi:Spy/CpxP family protein refolding chaperone